MIEAIGLVKAYGDHIAVDHLNFTVEKGQILGFLGPNGAGKSTTMNMLTGYISATEGTILVNGYDVLEEPELAKKSIGYLPEQPPVYPDMTVTEYLKFVTELKKVPKKDREREVERVIEVTQLQPMRGRLIQHLSKGYRQRVGIAQALVGNPEVIILDEPTVGLDPKQIIEIRDLMKSLAKEHTVLLSSHIMQEISAVCDHIMIISHGKLVLSGTPEELQKQANQGENIELEAMATKEQVTAMLERLEGVTEIAELPSESENSYAVSIQSTVDLREKLFTMFAEAKLPLLKLVRTKKTLEDIFLEATSAQPVAEEEEASEVLAESAEEVTTEAEVAGETVAEENEEKEEA
ncbi:MAG: ABC transporter ATP-binding protein [Lachnospiraceae bacterium]|nr:ABC transporter ATP-binding protein [Lachnospiraceae bacterium]